MAYHAGAELANLECFQINPLIKDYNGPACAYVTGPFGGYTANNRGDRFIECDYWSGQMMLEFWRELQSGTGPVFLKLDHLADETISEIETILHTNERPSRGRFHERRGTNYRHRMVEMHISEIGFCSGHSASGVWVNEQAETTVPGLYAAGDMASVPHNYMLGRVRERRHRRRNAADYCAEVDLPAHDPVDVAAEQERVLAPTRREDGLTPHEMEFKTRRLVNDYLQPPKVTAKIRSARNGSPRCARTSAISSPATRTSCCGRSRSSRSSIAPTWRRRPRCTAPRAVGGSITCASTIPIPTTTTGSATACITRITTATSPTASARSIPTSCRSPRTRCPPTITCASARRSRRSEQEPKMPIANHATSVPVVVDDDKCIAHKGCRVCVDVCPLDVLAIDESKGKAYMKYDECWYCMPCEVDCPTGAVTVNIPYLLR